MAERPKKYLYADFFIDQLAKNGYTTCFFLGGGNILHLLDSARTRMKCIPVTHENSAGIAAEYFNVASRDSGEKAFAMVTAGPGLTNILSSIGGAWLESRELLVVGGQARTGFLSRGTVRQVGHQEIDGAGITSPVTKQSFRIEKPIFGEELNRLIRLPGRDRKGPVFLELCLDVAAAEVQPDRGADSGGHELIGDVPSVSDEIVKKEAVSLREASRPLLLVGHGLSFAKFSSLLPRLQDLGIPVATSWNAADYLDYDDPIYAGRPNTYGMRWANAVIQQADHLISLGASLGVQQTGFNWEHFVPVGRITRVDIDQNQLSRPHPRVATPIHSDAAEFLERLVSELESLERPTAWGEWLDDIQRIKRLLPVRDFDEERFEGYAHPIEFVEQVSDWVFSRKASVIPCSSGGTYTTVMQAFRQKRGQLLTNSKGLASMGYGLAGAIGTAIARPGHPVLLLEGDGGFAQNIGEIGTISAQNLNVKMMIFVNGGYASIRLSQKAYFGGAYVGCDRETGLGLPDWADLFGSYRIPFAEVSGDLASNKKAVDLLLNDGPAALLVKIHPEQSFVPKVLSAVRSDGQIMSNPIHLMHPELPEEISNEVFKYLPEELRIS